MINSSKSQQGQKRELSLAEIEAVSGGLNPQPLPPQYSFFKSWNLRGSNFLKLANFNFRQVI